MSISVKIDKFVDEKLLPFVFKVSESPILFHDLLDANRQIKDGMIPNGGSLGYRMKMGSMYLSFFFLAHIFFILPGIVITHALLAKLNCHLSIIAAVIFTGLFFTWFTLYKEWLIDKISYKRVRLAWGVHFPLFDYDEYSTKVSSIYAESIRKKIPRGELEFFVMSALTKEQ